ncbi:MAG: hypothetical protein WAT79_10495 [Saprospiraceae bacterium]
MVFGKKDLLRSEKFKNLCVAFNKKYSEKDEYGILEFLKYFELYHRRGKITNLCMSKSENLDMSFYLFDYQYVIQAGNHARRIKQTVYFVQDRNMHLPVFFMKPEHLGHKIAAYLGWEDIDFETSPTFSDSYYLQGEDVPWIRDNFKEPVLSFFSASSGWNVEAANHFLLFYAKNALIPENILFDFYKMGGHVHFLFKESQKELTDL